MPRDPEAPPWFINSDYPGPLPFDVITCPICEGEAVDGRFADLSRDQIKKINYGFGVELSVEFSLEIDWQITEINKFARASEGLSFTCIITKTSNRHDTAGPTNYPWSVSGRTNGLACGNLNCGAEGLTGVSVDFAGEGEGAEIFEPGADFTITKETDWAETAIACGEGDTCAVGSDSDESDRVINPSINLFGGVNVSLCRIGGAFRVAIHCYMVFESGVLSDGTFFNPEGFGYPGGSIAKVRVDIFSGTWADWSTALGGIECDEEENLLASGTAGELLGVELSYRACQHNADVDFHTESEVEPTCENSEPDYTKIDRTGFVRARMVSLVIGEA